MTCRHERAEEVVVAPRLVAVGLLEREVVACVCPDCPAVLPAPWVAQWRERVRRERAALDWQARCPHDDVEEWEERTFGDAAGTRYRTCVNCGASDWGPPARWADGSLPNHTRPRPICD